MTFWQILDKKGAFFAFFGIKIRLFRTILGQCFLKGKFWAKNAVISDYTRPLLEV